jgi:hypothetical protein
VCTDISNLVVARLLSQYDVDIFYPVAYFARKHSSAKMTYEIYEEEILASV